MRAVKKAVASLGKYTDRNGQEKTRYHTMGKLMQGDDGSHCLKIDSIPVGEWNGWINFYDLDEDRQKPQQSAQPSQPPADDIPF